MLTLHAPAKVNLVLEVLRAHEGFHEISSILQTVDLFDTLTFEPADNIEFTCSEPALLENNLVLQAAHLLQRASGTQWGAHIHLQKRIPWAAGLGGGSSDAAATLRGLNELWQLRLSTEQLVETARSLGSDVPALVLGGTVHMRGSGDIVAAAPPLRTAQFVILIPDVVPPEAKTATLYRSLRPSMFTTGRYTDEALRSLQNYGIVPQNLMYNVFEQVEATCFPGIDCARRELANVVDTAVHLAGSGPALFTIVETPSKAERAASLLSTAGYRAFAAQSIGRE
ncbi:MAG: 4-(cytidine 5'-diphospho)-2-C-methyl-D-erythritol kinase [Anaerolineae bacterium]|nr:4-(cytidine 5'-diphospho)-2-C-methyl-D-erythritol kinase [Anaerolineae bacterium]